MSLLLCCLGMIAIGLPDGALGVAWPSLREAFALPRAALGLVLAASGFGTFCAGLACGRLIQRLGFANVLPASAGFAALALLGETLAPNVSVFCLAALAAGIGFGTLDTAVNATAALRFRARDINWIHGCYGIGATIGPLLMTAAITRGPRFWRLGYAILALSTIGVAAIIARSTRPLSDGRGPERSAPGGWRDATRHPLVRLQLPLFLVYTGLEVLLGQWSFSVLTEARGMPVGLAGAVTSGYWASLTAGRFASGAIIERIGADTLLRLATLGAVIGTALFAVTGGTTGVAGLLLAGASLAPIFPTLMARAPARLGHAIALHAVGFKISAALIGAAGLPALAGVIAQWLGLAVIGWIAVAAAVTLLALHEALLARTAA